MRPHAARRLARAVPAAFAFALASGLAAAPARAQDELGLGKMWTFERPPLAYLKREYGFTPDAAWFDAVRLASLRFGNGCSASFVSPKGLILTNQHCVRDDVAKAQGAHDWVRDGFAAKELGDEVRLQGLTVQQLVRTTDVTAAIEEGIAADAAPEAAAAQRKRNQESVLATAAKERPELRPQVVKLFQGAVWQLYEYRVFDDVRLVFAPHLQIAHFGGDPDNFTYPRHAVDFAFCRAYVDGEPADTGGSWFRFGDGPDEGELVILTGNPGGTQRLLTVAQLEYHRDARYPRVRETIDNRIAILEGFAARDSELEKRLRTTILGLQNAQKLYRGEHRALLDPAFLTRKQTAEGAFRARVAAAPELQQQYGAVWSELAEVAAKKVELDAVVNFHTPGGSPLLLRALALLEYAATGDEAKAKEAVAVRAGDDPVQRALFADHLARAARRLPRGAADPWLAAVANGGPPEQAAARIEKDSRLHDGEYTAELVRGGRAAIEACADPALEVARALRPLLAANRAAWGAVEARENALGAKIARVLFAVYGHDVSPDATFTLRFSDGRALGYPCNGSLAPWRTVFHGLYARHAEFDGKPPFDLPEPWLHAKDRIDLRAAVNFVCTTDSTGGNSGSPVIDSKRELVGLLFDGNIESLANEFLYGERVERSVCVHPQAIVETLAKVYGAARVLAELRGE